MRKTLAMLLAVALLGLGSAFAQDDMMMANSFWAGASGGFPGAQVHFGVENVVSGLDIRLNVGFNYGAPAGVYAGVYAGVDLLYGLPVDMGDLPLDVYVGGGPSVNFAPFGLTIAALVGGEYRLGDVGLPEGGVFAEVGGGVTVLPAFAPAFGGKLGFNYHF